MANGPCGRSSPLRLKRLGAEEDKSKRAEGSLWAVYSPASVWRSDVGRIFFFFFDAYEHVGEEAARTVDREENNED